MSRVVLLGLLVLGALASVVRAEEFGGFTFTPPADSTRSATAEHVEFVKITGQTFCQIALFSGRPATTRDADVATERKVILEKNFTVDSASAPVSRKAKHVPFVAISANVHDAGGNRFAAALYVVLGTSTVSSVLLTSTNQDTLAKCPISGFLDSLAVVAPAAPPAPPAPAVTSPAPPAPAAAQESITGAWATGASTGGSAGALVRRQYTFNADGTYAYFSEVFDGAKTWIHVRESGTYALAGNQLTVTPKSSTISKRDWKKVISTNKQALEKVTYTFKKVYFSGIKEWNLALTPPKQTARDGAFTTADGYKDSYLLRDSYKPEWKFP